MLIGLDLAKMGPSSVALAASPVLAHLGALDVAIIAIYFGW